MSAAITRGHWAAVEVGQGGSADNPVPVYEIIADGHVRVAEAMTEGDARLCAAAPDLYAALRDMIDWLDDGNRMLSDACAADVARARSALSHAQGDGE